MKIFKMNGKNIPYISIGTSPFMGAGQFGVRGYRWRSEFLHNPELMSKLMIKSYECGAVGIEMVPIGRIPDAIKLVKEKYPDYIVISSTHWSDINIEQLATEYSSTDIFLHGNISDCRNKNQINSLFKEIRSYNVIPGIATHQPYETIKFIQESDLNCEIFLVPFNKMGYLMGNQSRLEKLIDKSSETFIEMKSLAVGKIPPREAFEYIGKHNISGITVGLVTIEEIMETVPIALKLFNISK
jgi:hypothetical protein